MNPLLEKLVRIYPQISEDQLATYVPCTKDWPVETVSVAVDLILQRTAYRTTWPTVDEVGLALGLGPPATPADKQYLIACSEGKINMGSQHRALRKLAMSIRKQSGA